MLEGLYALTLRYHWVSWCSTYPNTTLHHLEVQSLDLALRLEVGGLRIPLLTALKLYPLAKVHIEVCDFFQIQ